MRIKDAPDFLLNSSFGKKLDENTIDYTDYVLKVLAELEIDALIAIGGDDTLSFAARLHKEKFPVVGIPKTMDNDVYGTDYCAVSTAVTRSVTITICVLLGSHVASGWWNFLAEIRGDKLDYGAARSDWTRDYF